MNQGDPSRFAEQAPPDPAKRLHHYGIVADEAQVVTTKPLRPKQPEGKNAAVAMWLQRRIREGKIAALGESALVVLMSLLTHVSSDVYKRRKVLECWPPIKLLAEESRRARSTVHAAIKKLADAQLIERAEDGDFQCYRMLDGEDELLPFAREGDSEFASENDAENEAEDAALVSSTSRQGCPARQDNPSSTSRHQCLDVLDTTVQHVKTTRDSGYIDFKSLKQTTTTNAAAAAAPAAREVVVDFLMREKRWPPRAAADIGRLGKPLEYIRAAIAAAEYQGAKPGSKVRSVFALAYDFCKNGFDESQPERQRRIVATDPLPEDAAMIDRLREAGKLNEIMQSVLKDCRTENLRKQYQAEGLNRAGYFRNEVCREARRLETAAAMRSGGVK